MEMDEYLQRYLALAYRYLGVRSRSEKEIRDYLHKKKATEEIIEHIVAKLYKLQYLNDKQFAQEWIRSRAKTKPKGKAALIFELRQKGVSDEIIHEALSENQEDLPDELTQAKELILRRIEKLRHEPRAVIYQKVGAFLSRRGFSWEISKKAIDAALQEQQA